MGGNESKNRNMTTASSSAAANPPKGKIPRTIQHVLLLYKAKDDAQKDLMDSFQDALTEAADGKIEIKYDINMADLQGDMAGIIEGLDWLNQQNNVILIRWSPDLMPEIKRIIREKNFIDEKGILHGKIITVSFGKADGFPPNGIRRLENDSEKDFCFESDITSKDFKTANAKATIYSILDALKSKS